MAKQVIATKTVVVHDENIGIDRRVVEGVPVPPDLVDAYLAKTGEGKEKPAKPAAPAAKPKAEPTGDGGTTPPEPVDYEKQGAEELQKLVDDRKLTPTGTGKDGNVIKSDLVAALKAHDESQSQ